MKSINRLCEDPSPTLRINSGRSISRRSCDPGGTIIASAKRGRAFQAREDNLVNYVSRVSVLILFLLPLLIFAQPQFFGYFESEASTMALGSETYTYGFNKLRLDVEARPNDHVLIGANVNFEKYWGKTTWNVYDFIPGYQDLGAVMNIALNDTILLDNMYMRLRFPFADLTVGRQQLSPGVGYAWNPTDIFNTKSLMDPSYEQTGVPAIRVEVPMVGRFSIDAVVDPVEDWDKSTKQVWFKGGVKHFDFALTRAEYTWYQIPLATGTYNFGTKVERMLMGGSIVGELLGFGVWAEYGYNDLDLSIYGSCPTCTDYLLPLLTTPFEEWVLGLDRTFDNSLYVLAEYFHNGYGIARKEALSLSDYVYAFEGVTHSLMQDYTFVYIMHPTFDYVSLSAIAFANLNDNSGVISPMLEWNAFQNTNMSVQGSLAWGEADTEFGLQDWGLILNVTSNF
ncbi:MAG: hypothetical protein K9M49_00490 [Candidatus Marinimicrobia bacterium]|nr:hypothetical protein [Candidatus Neomarinimicrobiota bacterium]MCF7903605.1 hypothetical protein [Candidatus Neomarinimicrobiota bacterium]